MVQILHRACFTLLIPKGPIITYRLELIFEKKKKGMEFEVYLMSIKYIKQINLQDSTN